MEKRRPPGRASPSGTRGLLPEAPLRLVDVTPRPRSPGHDGAHHGMARLMEVLGRVLTGRGVAAADMAARLARPEFDPARAFFQALLTGARRSRRREVGRGEVLQVFTRLRHGVLLQIVAVNVSLWQGRSGRRCSAAGSLRQAALVVMTNAPSRYQRPK